MIGSIMFYIIAALIIFAAIKMIFSSNLIHSILFMVAAFIGIAFIYILLEADYLAIVQILVYVGAISILFVFGVMLTRRNTMADSNKFNKYKVYGIFVALALGIILIRILLMAKFGPTVVVEESSTIKAISGLMLNEYAIAFEVSGILLLVAMIGAIIIGKGVKNPK